MRRMTVRRSRATRAVLTAAALAMLAAAAGCQSSQASPDRASPAASPTAARPPVLLRSADLRLPLDAYLLSPAEVRRTDRARRIFLRDCMRSFGFEIHPPAVDEATGLRSWNDRRYGVTDAAFAAKAGYRLGTRQPLGRTPQPELSAAAGAVLTGQSAAIVGGKRVPDGGCVGQAQRRLDAGSPQGADPGLPQRLSMASFGASRDDPAVREATRRWSACMAARGLRYAGPLDPPRDRRFGKALSAVEISVARTDIACKSQTNLVGIWFTAESGYQRRSIQQQSAALELARQANQAQLANTARAGA